jgi:hypothetical protein
MIKSKFIASLLELLSDGDSDGLLLKRQLPYLTEKEYEYTGSGLFIRFNHTKEILNFKLLTETSVYNGVWIKSKELTEEAEAILHIKDGMIDYLEIWSFDGNYPSKELDSYELRQVWKDSPGKVISV